MEGFEYEGDAGVEQQQQHDASASDFQSYNGVGEGHEAAAGEYAPPAEENGVFDDGAKLPPPSQMGSEESILLREWRRKKAIELEEKARVSREKHQQVLDDAKAELEAFYKKREMQVTQSKTNNREKEKAYVDNLLNLNSKKGGNYWESVCAFTNFDAPKKEKAKKKDEPSRVSTQLNDTKQGKHTDLARMRQVLLKLKHNPPPSFSAAASTTATPAAAPSKPTTTKTAAKSSAK